jgi:AcrR family transcriptional regulator
MSRITARTGLGKGSLYHFFPGGKEEMAAVVLADVDDWFERNIFAPLRDGEPAAAIASMWRDVDAYFQSGGRVCLVGAFALDGGSMPWHRLSCDWVEAPSTRARRRKTSCSVSRARSCCHAQRTTPPCSGQPCRGWRAASEQRMMRPCS